LQLPQFEAFVAVSTHAPLHNICPTGQSPVTHALSRQICPLVQRRPQPPQ
jgi:hypothetical protein